MVRFFFFHLTYEHLKLALFSVEQMDYLQGDTVLPSEVQIL